jgi:hypothetical protein
MSLSYAPFTSDDPAFRDGNQVRSLTNQIQTAPNIADAFVAVDELDRCFLSEVATNLANSAPTTTNPWVIRDFLANYRSKIFEILRSGTYLPLRGDHKKWLSNIMTRIFESEIARPRRQVETRTTHELVEVIVDRLSIPGFCLRSLKIRAVLERTPSLQSSDCNQAGGPPRP